MCLLLDHQSNKRLDFISSAGKYLYRAVRYNMSVARVAINRDFPDYPQVQGNRATILPPRDKSYHRSTVEGIGLSPRPSDGLILETRSRLDGHFPRFTAIQTHLSHRFHLSMHFLGRRRNGSWSQISNQAHDFLDQSSR